MSDRVQSGVDRRTPGDEHGEIVEGLRHEPRIERGDGRPQALGQASVHGRALHARTRGLHPRLTSQDETLRLLLAEEGVAEGDREDADRSAVPLDHPGSASFEVGNRRRGRTALPLRIDPHHRPRRQAGGRPREIAHRLRG